MANSKIDIIVSFVDESDPNWKTQFNKYKQLELQNKTQNETNRQAFSEERYRDWDLFRFWFRSTEKNCPWLNKIFLVVQDENQIPKWLNRNHPKLRIVYHNEFIPSELLPTFNGLAIEMFYYNIKDLSNNFICCNDDFYFLNPIEANRFFENNIPCQDIIPVAGTDLPETNVWYSVLNNISHFIQRFQPADKPKFKFAHSHLPEARQKNFEKNIMDKYGTEILNSFKPSHFRHKDNYFPWLFIDMMKLSKYSKQKKLFKNSSLIEIPQLSLGELDKTMNLDMACFNDTQNIQYFQFYKEYLHKLFKKKFPEKSSYELDDFPKEREYEKKLAILIPQYKEIDNDIKRLLDSIELQQNININDFVVFICNDGSEIKLSREFLDSYSYEIRYLENSHQGVSATRQFLLDNSSSEYIIYCDADDMFLKNTALSIYFNLFKIKQYDIIIPWFDEELAMPYGTTYTIRKKDGSFIHGKVFRREFLEKNNIKWNTELSLNEDSYFVSLAISLADNNIRELNESLYLWRNNKGSVSREAGKVKMSSEFINSSTLLIEELLRRKLDRRAAVFVWMEISNLYYKIPYFRATGAKNKEINNILEKFKIYYNRFNPLLMQLSYEEKKAISELGRIESPLPSGPEYIDQWLFSLHNEGWL